MTTLGLAGRHWSVTRLTPVICALLVGVASVWMGRLSSLNLTIVATVILLGLFLVLTVNNIHIAVLMLFAITIPLPLEATMAGFIISLKDVVLVLAIAAWFIQRPPLKMPDSAAAATLYCLGFAMTLIGFVSATTAHYQDVAVRQIVSWLTVGALTLMLSRTLRSAGVAVQAFFLLVAVTDLVCLDTLTQLASHGQVAPLAAMFQRNIQFANVGNGFDRPESVFGSANTLAGFLAIIAPLCLYLATREWGGVLRIFSVASLVLIVMATLATLSRGGIFAEMASLLCYVVLQARSHRKTTGVLASLALVAGIIASGLTVGVLESVIARLSVIAPNGLSDPSGRFAYWALVLSLLPGHELFGLGLDNLRLVNPFLIGGLTSQNASAHNLWLQALMETGFVGLALFCLFATRLITLLVRPASASDTTVRDLARVILSCWFGVAVVGTTEYLATSELQNVYALLAAFTLALPTLSGSIIGATERSETPTVIGKRIGRFGEWP